MISVATLPFRTISIGINRVCKEKAKELKDSAEGEIELAKAAYYFGRALLSNQIYTMAQYG